MASVRRAARVGRQDSAGAGGTRAAILEFLCQVGEPVGVARICEEFGLNHTGVRRHLANLRDAGLVARSAAPPAGRGRPTLEFQATAAAHEEPGARQRDLVRLLLEMVTTGEDARAVGRRAGERLATEVRAASAGLRPPTGDVARDLDSPDLEDTLRAIEIAARRMGFDPARHSGPDGREEVVLRHCPFADGAVLAPDVVCELHLGMVEGVGASIGSDARMTFAFADPRLAGCRLVVD